MLIAKRRFMPRLIRPSHRPARFTALAGALTAGLCLLAPSGRGTIVGLNQIVTPDIQPTGVLALSAQVQHPTIGNRQQIQFELGLTPRLELAWFQGFKPNEGLFDAELNLLQTGPHLLTVGLINWSTRGGSAQPVLEYGCYTDANHFVVGGLQAGSHTQLLLGCKRQLSERFAVSADFQSGPGNSVTVGFTYNFTPALSLNPALYWTNSRPHHLLGYVVLTYNLTVWK
jgi:hypothetical protein